MLYKNLSSSIHDEPIAAVGEAFEPAVPEAVKENIRKGTNKTTETNIAKKSIDTELRKLEAPPVNSAKEAAERSFALIQMKGKQHRPAAYEVGGVGDGYNKNTGESFFALSQFNVPLDELESALKNRIKQLQDEGLLDGYGYIAGKGIKSRPLWACAEGEAANKLLKAAGHDAQLGDWMEIYVMDPMTEKRMTVCTNCRLLFRGTGVNVTSTTDINKR